MHHKWEEIIAWCKKKRKKKHLKIIGDQLPTKSTLESLKDNSIECHTYVNP